MAEAPASPRNGKLFLAVASRWQNSLRWRIACAYGGFMLILGLSIAGWIAGETSRSIA